MKTSVTLILTLLSLYSFSQNSQLDKVVKFDGPNAAVTHLDAFDNGDIVAGGYFLDSIDIDPGPNSDWIHTRNSTTEHAFIVRLDSNLNLLWFGNYESKSGIALNGIQVDSAQNIVVCGSFQDSTDLDPDTSVFSVTTRQIGVYNFFVSKLDANGKLIWLNRYESLERCYASRLAIDHNNNIWMTGEFRTSIDFDPNGTGFSLSAAERSKYILKLDTHGDFNWVGSFGNSSVYIRGLKIDGDNNVIISGNFSDSTDFDPDPNTYLSFSTRMTGSDGFIVHLDNNGSLNWAWQFGEFHQDGISECAIDPNNNLYFPAFYSDTVDIDPDTSVTLNLYSGSPIEAENIILVLNQNGQYVDHMRPEPGSRFPGSNYILWSQQNGIQTSGDFRGNVDFDPSSDSLNGMTRPTAVGVFMNKYDLNLNYRSSAVFNSYWAVSLFGMAQSAQGGTYLFGDFTDTVDFDPGNGVNKLIGNQYGQGRTPYILKLKTGPISSSFDDQSATKIKVFPNPSFGRFQVEGLDASSSVKILDQLGRVVDDYEMNGNVLTINETAGVYFLHIQSDSRLQTLKLIKQ